MALERYEEDDGNLPATLQEFRAEDDWVMNIDLSIFDYNPTGTVTINGTTWLFSTPYPTNQGQLIVGGNSRAECVPVPLR